MSESENSAVLVFICFAIMYSALSVLALIRTLKMYKKLSITRYVRLFYILAFIECIIRALTFISIVIDIENIEYETLFILVSVPDSAFILIYLMLLILTMNIYYTSHITVTLSDSLLHKTTTKQNKFAIIVLFMIFALLLIQFISYLVYLAEVINSVEISEENACVNIIVPALGAIYIFYLQILFSGRPIKSPLWRSKLRRISSVSIFWTISRIIKGVLDLEDQSSITNIINAVVDPQHSEVALLKAALCVAVIIIAEMVCLFLVYDYAFLGIFVLSDEDISSPRIGKFKKSLIQDNPYIKDNEIKVLEQLIDVKKKTFRKNI